LLVGEHALPAGIGRADEYCFTSDMNLALRGMATAYPKSELLSDRNEGRFLASAETDGQWFAVSKIVLTMFTSQGTDAAITGLPERVIEVLRLTCPEILMELRAFRPGDML